MSKTHTVPANSMAAAFEKAGVTEETIDEIVAQSEETAHTASLIEILSDSTHNVRRNIIGSFSASLNFTLLANCRIAVRQGLRITDPLDDQLTVDQRAELEDKLGINDRGYTERSLEYMGNRPTMNASEIVTRLGAIRAFVIDRQAEVHSGLLAFRPRPLEESFDYMLSQLPESINPSDPALLVLMHILQKTADECMVIRNVMIKHERDALLKVRDDMLAMARTASLRSDGLTNAIRDNVDPGFVEQQFDTLPATIKVNLFIAACNSIVTAWNQTMRQIITRGDVTNAGDLPICTALHKRAMTYLQQLVQKHESELADACDRGFKLKEVKHILGSTPPTK